MQNRRLGFPVICRPHDLGNPAPVCLSFRIWKRRPYCLPLIKRNAVISRSVPEREAEVIIGYSVLSPVFPASGQGPAPDHLCGWNRWNFPVWLQPLHHQCTNLGMYPLCPLSLSEWVLGGDQQLPTVGLRLSIFSVMFSPMSFSTVPQAPAGLNRVLRPSPVMTGVTFMAT